VHVCSLRCPACNAHAPYCHLSPIWLYRIYPNYLINGTIFWKILRHPKCVFWFYLEVLSEAFLVLEIIQRYIIVNIHRCPCKSYVIIVILYWKFNFLYRSSMKSQISNFMKIRPVVAELFHVDGRTDRHDETNSRSSQFSGRARNDPKLLIYLLIPSSRVLPEKLTGFHIVKKFPAFYGTRWFITVFTSDRHLSLSWASSIQSILLRPTSWRSILILSSHLHLGLSSVLFPSGFPTNSPLPHTHYMPRPSHSRFYHSHNIGW